MAIEQKKATKRTLDFTNVKDVEFFNPKRMESGLYAAKITKVTEAPSKQGNDMWTFTVVLKQDKSATYPVYCTLTQDSLWKLRDLITATGKDVPKKKLNFDPNSIINKEIGIVLEDDEYDGQEKSVINGFTRIEEVEEDDAPATKAPAKKRAASKSKAVENPPEDDDDDDDDEIEDDDEMDVEDL